MSIVCWNRIEVEDGVIYESLDISMERLQAVVSRFQTTLSVLSKAAWAIVLRNFLRKDQVVFGNVVSGRDLPIRDIDK